MATFLNITKNKLTEENLPIIAEANIDIPFLEPTIKPNFAKGIKLHDDNGKIAAKTFGWLFSLKSIYKQFDEEKHYFRIADTEIDTEQIANLSLGVLQATLKRTQNVPAKFYNLTDKEKLITGKYIINQSLDVYEDQDEERMKEFLKDSYIICDIITKEKSSYQIQKEKYSNNKNKISRPKGGKST